MSELLSWLNLLLLPVLGFVISIKVDVATLQAQREDDRRRLANLERRTT